MRFRSLFPWVCVLAALLGLAWLYAANQKKDQELAALRADSQQLQQLRAEVEDAKTNSVQAASDEIARLRKDNEELLRLRNEVRQLRGDKQQLNSQLQTAQSQVQGAQAQMEAMRANPPPPAVPGQLTPAAQAAFAARYGARYGAAPTSAAPASAVPLSTEQANRNACVNNLRQIDGAKQQWALDHQKPGTALVIATDLLPYFKGNVMPVCPAGGVYTLNPISIPPICNIPGHTIGR